MITIARRAEEGEEPCRTVLDAMLYTVAKQIGAMHVALHGKEQAIIITEASPIATTAWHASNHR